MFLPRLPAFSTAHQNDHHHRHHHRHHDHLDPYRTRNHQEKKEKKVLLLFLNASTSSNTSTILLYVSIYYCPTFHRKTHFITTTSASKITLFLTFAATVLLEGKTAPGEISCLSQFYRLRSNNTTRIFMHESC